MTTDSILDLTSLPILAFLLTYLLHSTLLLGGSWLATRYRLVTRAATLDALWKVSLVGGLVTATLQTVLGGSPLGGDISLPAATPRAPTQLVQPAVHLVRADHGNTERGDTAHGARRLAHTGAATPERMAVPTLLRVPRERTPAPISRESLAPRRTRSAHADLAASTDAEAAEAAEAVPTIGWPSLLFGLWALLAAVGLGRAFALRRRLGRVLGRRRAVLDGRLIECVDRLCDEAGVKRRIKLSCSALLSGPVAIGRDEVCLPPRALSELSPQAQEAMLAHELAHLIRRDPLWLSLCNLLEAVFFFQPLNRLGRRRLEAASEYLCDDWAVARTGRRVAFAECLAQVAGWIVESRQPALAPGMARADASLVERVRRLAGGRAAARRRSTLVALSLALLCAVSCGVPVIRAGDEDSLFDRLLAAVRSSLADQDVETAVADDPAPAPLPTPPVASVRPRLRLAAPAAVVQAPRTDLGDDTQVVLNGDLEFSFERGRLRRFSVDGERYTVESSDDDGLLVRGDGLELSALSIDISQVDDVGRVVIVLGADDSQRVTVRREFHENGWVIEHGHDTHLEGDLLFGDDPHEDMLFGEDLEHLDREYEELMEELDRAHEQLYEEYEEAIEDYESEWVDAHDELWEEYERGYEDFENEFEAALEIWEREYEPAMERHHDAYTRALEELEREYERADDEFGTDEDAFDEFSREWEDRYEDLEAEFEDEWERFEADFEDEWHAVEEEIERAMEAYEAEWEQAGSDSERAYEDEFFGLEEQIERQMEELEREMEALDGWYERAYGAWEDSHGRDCDHDCERECAFGCTHPDDEPEEDALEVTRAPSARSVPEDALPRAAHLFHGVEQVALAR